MNGRNIIIVIILIIAAIIFKSHISKSVEVVQTGNNVTITTGKHNISAVISSSDITDTYLVLGGSANSELGFSTPFTVMPFYTANRLARQYGNFLMCASPGAAEAKRNTKFLLLYPADSEVEKEMNSIDKLTKKGKDPVVKMTLVELFITDHKMKSFGQETTIGYRGSNMISCLVKDIQLVQEDAGF